MKQTEKERKLMAIIDRISEEKVEIPIREIEILAEKEGIENPIEIIESLIGQGLITETSENKITKIAKRLFW